MLKMPKEDGVMEETFRDMIVRDITGLQKDSNQQFNTEQDKASEDESVYSFGQQLKFSAEAKATWNVML